MYKARTFTPPAILLAALLFLTVAFGETAVAEKDEKFSPFFKLATLDGTMSDAAAKVKDALTGGGFEVIGKYNPEGKEGLKSIAYTRKDLQDITLKVKDRGLLASILKVGLNEVDGKIDVSMVNPEYLFRAYLMKEFFKYEDDLKAMASDAQIAMKIVGGEFEPFGGELNAKRLEHYHYKIGMEYFDDPVDLAEYDSFEKGLETIRKNLAEKKGGAFEVFSVVRSDANVAVFGIGLGDEETGEKHFLPKIGERHVAALPYEIILSDRKATMLHGRFRIATHWPALSMVFGKFSFAKIMSTPKAINNTMLEVTK